MQAGVSLRFKLSLRAPDDPCAAHAPIVAGAQAVPRAAVHARQRIAGQPRPDAVAQGVVRVVRDHQRALRQASVSRRLPKGFLIIHTREDMGYAAGAVLDL